LEEIQRNIREEMEDRHYAAQRDMEDRHRVAQQAERDADRLAGRQTGVAGGVSGAAKQAMGVVKKGAEPVPAAMLDVLRPQMEAGIQQMMRDIPGLTEGQIKYVVEQGQMEAGVVLAEAGAARQEQAIAAERRRAKEERGLGREQHHEDVSTGRDLASKEREMTYGQSDEKKRINRGMELEETRRLCWVSQIRVNNISIHLVFDNRGHCCPSSYF
jgi:hypothetical protein